MTMDNELIDALSPERKNELNHILGAPDGATLFIMLASYFPAAEVIQGAILALANEVSLNHDRIDLLRQLYTDKAQCRRVIVAANKRHSQKSKRHFPPDKSLDMPSNITVAIIEHAQNLEARLTELPLILNGFSRNDYDKTKLSTEISLYHPLTD